MTNRALLISHEVVGPLMAGPGIRYYHLAKVLSQHIQTTLAIPQESSGKLDYPGFSIARYQTDEWPTLAPLVHDSDICLFPSGIAAAFPELGESKAYLVVDGYDPLLAEWLALYDKQDADHLHRDWRHLMTHLHDQFQMGDFFICASERQRDWWLGLLEAHGRINPATYQAAPSLRNLIDVVAYGLPDTKPIHTRQVVKGIWDGIEDHDHLLLWGGGLWAWLDPVTAIQAVGRIWQQRQDVKLIFPGTRHPNPKMVHLPTSNVQAMQAAKDLGLLNRGVFFGDRVPYADWTNLLLECDIALTLHHDTLETRLAFRSRVLEYIWAGLPVVASQGDATSELICQFGLGHVVECEDVSAVTGAILDLLEHPEDDRGSRFDQARQMLTWERAAEPLVRFCTNPWQAADKLPNPDTAEMFYDPSLEEQLRKEREHWVSLIEAYESGRFLRAMKWIERQRQRFSRVKSGA